MKIRFQRKNLSKYVENAFICCSCIGLVVFWIFLWLSSLHPIAELPPEILPIRAAAEQNDAEAQYQLALFYDKAAKGPLDPNHDESLRWMCLAAQQGHPEALRCVRCFEEMVENNSEVPVEVHLYYDGKTLRWLTD